VGDSVVVSAQQREVLDVGGAFEFAAGWTSTVVFVPPLDVMRVGLFGFAGAPGEHASAVADRERSTLLSRGETDFRPCTEGVAVLVELDGPHVPRGDDVAREGPGEGVAQNVGDLRVQQILATLGWVDDDDGVGVQQHFVVVGDTRSSLEEVGEAFGCAA